MIDQKHVQQPEAGRLSEEPLTVRLLTGRAYLEYLAGVAVWLAALIYFWTWWFKPEHYIDFFGFFTSTLLFTWITFLPVYFLTVFFLGRRSNGPLRLPAGSRIAMVVTKAPSESFSIVSTTLRAMLAQDVPHDTWLADEDPSPDTLEWCRRHGVLVSTRRDRLDYHRTTWPRRTRCKEGNLAFFYDHYGYHRYDFVVQLDADHVPEPDYLYQMLRPFADPGVGYVSAPSICDRNAGASWSTRGRLYAEASMHGSLQAGYSGGLAPLCIGSHYAVRTAALREIGGLGPELAEDHSTTLMMNAGGWRGVHALDAIAHGEGPRTFADLVTQEFQWSRSLVTILLQHSPGLVPKLPMRLKFQFLFCQLWYPMTALFMTFMFIIPVIALVRDKGFVNVTYPSFLLHFAPIPLVLIVLFYRWRTTGSFRPVDAKVLSWEAILYLLARWPWFLAGTIAAIRDWAAGSFVDFRVTPKGSSEVDPLPLRVLAPYLVLSVGSLLPVLLIDGADESRGFYIFAIVNAVLYTLLLLVIITQHARENVVRVTNWAYRPVFAATFLALILMAGVGTSRHGMDGLEALAWGAGRLSLFSETYSIAGAGLGEAGTHQRVFQPRWLSRPQNQSDTNQ
jgi:cellulose synthase (UDP-forming)